MLIKITLITIIVYWIVKIAYNVHLNMMDTGKKLRLGLGMRDKSDWVWIYIVAITRILAWVMAFVTAFYAVIKFL